MRVVEIFNSLQGEGYHTGLPAVFLRLAGCNLRCPFCDTDFSNGHDMSEEQIADAIRRHDAPIVVVTGGEPSLQLTTTLVNAIHTIGRRVCVETNGTHPLPHNVDWITLSPKDAYLGPTARPVITYADELKIVFDGTHPPLPYPNITVKHRFLQPCDTGDTALNATIMQQTVAYCLAHPQWRLSLQTHKILNIR